MGVSKQEVVLTFKGQMGSLRISTQLWRKEGDESKSIDYVSREREFTW